METKFEVKLTYREYKVLQKLFNNVELTPDGSMGEMVIREGDNVEGWWGDDVELFEHMNKKLKEGFELKGGEDY